MDQTGIFARAIVCLGFAFLLGCQPESSVVSVKSKLLETSGSLASNVT